MDKVEPSISQYSCDYDIKLRSDLIQERFGTIDYPEMKNIVMDVGHHFRPEFINRIDEVVVFHPLGKRKHCSDCTNSVASFIPAFRRAWIYHVTITGAALEKLSEVGFDPIYGARPLKRAIQQEVENPLAQDILSGKLLPGKRDYLRFR